VASKKKPILRLVRFKGEYFPADDQSFEQLKESKLTVFRIPEQILPTLQHTMLKGFSVEVLPFASVYQKILETFHRERLSNLPSLAWKTESNLVLLAFDQKDLELANQYVMELGFVMGRYGVKVARENRVRTDSEGKPSRHNVRLECKADPDVNPSEFFRNAIPPAEEIVRLNLTSCASLLFSSRPSKSYPGRQSLGLAFEDHLNGEWVQAFSREFSLATLDPHQVVLVINWLIHMTNQSKSFKPPVTPVTRRTR
jgi:hypothetical protein